MSEEKYKNEEEIKKFVEEKEIPQKEKIEEDPFSVGPKIQDTSEVKKPWDKKDISSGNEIGVQKINIKDLPTKGLFYPDGAEILIRSATAGEIRHWSTLDETNLSVLDDMLNYILERCVTVKFPSGHSSWRDIKEIDRFYIILAIHEYTFIKGENTLQVKVSETKKINVRKEMVDYISLDERIMKYYNPDERCFIITLKEEKTPFKVTLPSVGVTNWLKNYVFRKRQQNEPIEEDFINFAPFVILDWRGLGDETYKNYLLEGESWSIKKISVLSWLKDIFVESVEPVIKYKDEQGGERQVPLNFQGGIKSLFLISDPLG